MSGKKLVTFNCWIFGEDSSDVFPVDISLDQTVFELKKMVRSRKKSQLAPFSARKLGLFKVFVALEDFEEVLAQITSPTEIDGAEQLGPVSKLSQLFDGPLLGTHIHIAVQPPKSEPPNTD